MIIEDNDVLNNNNNNNSGLLSIGNTYFQLRDTLIKQELILLDLIGFEIDEPAEYQKVFYIYKRQLTC